MGNSAQQDFLRDIRQMKQYESKHQDYISEYKRLRGQRRHILNKIRGANIKDMSDLKGHLSKITSKMEEARNRSINILKEISKKCEEIEVNEVIHELDRSNFRLIANEKS